MDTPTPTTPRPGEWSRRAAQHRCGACGYISLAERCPRCGQLAPWRREQPEEPSTERPASTRRKAKGGRGGGDNDT